ncbi:MAG: hypothetical protein ACNA8H_05830 [Anaerolineales bacterium]
MNLQYLELASPGSLAHGVDARSIFLSVRRLGWIGKQFDNLNPVALGLLCERKF